MTAIARSEPAGDLIEAPEAVDARLLSILAEKDADPDFWSSKTRDRTDSAHSIFQKLTEKSVSAVATFHSQPF